MLVIVRVMTFDAEVNLLLVNISPTFLTFSLLHHCTLFERFVKLETIEMYLEKTSC